MRCTLADMGKRIIDELRWRWTLFRWFVRRLFSHHHKIVWNDDPSRTLVSTTFGPIGRFGECSRCGQLIADPARLVTFTWANDL